jgi:hypothetical protein
MESPEKTDSVISQTHIDQIEEIVDSEITEPVRINYNSNFSNAL